MRILLTFGPTGSTVDISVTHARPRAVERILGIVADLLAPPLIVVAGPCGIGLSSLLAATCAAVREHGSPANLVRARPSSDLRPALPPRLPSVAEMTQQPGAVLAVDDAHWLDAASLDQLETLVRKLAGTGCRCVCTVRLPLPTDQDWPGRRILAQLLDEGLAVLVNLRPLGAAEAARVVAERLGGSPSPQLAQQLRRITRHRPKVLLAAVDAYRRADAVRVVARQAYLIRPDVPPSLAECDAAALEVANIDEVVWSVARAMAVLSPLGPAAARLVTEATGIADTEVARALRVLCDRGALRHLPRRDRWLFRVPLLQQTLAERLGPYERRALAQAAVTAVWRGEAHCDTGEHLAALLVHAGRMVDPERAGAELLESGRSAAANGDWDRAERWFWAASHLAAWRADRASILLEHAISCIINGRGTQCLQTLDALLHELYDQLPADLLFEVHMTHLSALSATGDLDTVERIASGEWWPWPDRPAEQALTRAGANYWLGRWRAARELIDAGQSLWPPDSVNAFWARLFGGLAGVWLGQPQRFRAGLADLGSWRCGPGQQCYQVIYHVNGLLLLGDLPGAERMMTEQHKVPEQLGLTEQAAIAARRGQFDQALELTRRCVATTPPFGYEPRRVDMASYSAAILLARGQITQAHDLLSRADAGQPVMTHILAGPRAWMDTLLGEHTRGRRCLDQALSEATRTETVVGADRLWFFAAALAFAVGDLADVRRCEQQAQAVAALLETDRARMFCLLIGACLDPAGEAGAQALGLARRLRDPLELALVIDFLVRVGAAGPALLSEAYDLFGHLDALLLRARTRNLMREHDIKVPGRNAAVAENDRLLAVLVAEGLGNKQIALLLETSERSVHGRLSRLFSRTGHRSRVELAMAMLEGDAETP
jgi:tetratricopeptide (TPR) repeat protein